MQTACDSGGQKVIMWSWRPPSPESPGIQAIRLAGQVVYLLSHLTSPNHESLCSLEFLPNLPFISVPGHFEEFIYNLPPFQQMELLFLLITLLKFQLSWCLVTAR